MSISVNRWSKRDIQKFVHYKDICDTGCSSNKMRVESWLPSKHLLVFKTSWRRLQLVFSVTIFHLPRPLQDVLEDKKNYYTEDVLKACLEDAFKTSWRQTKCLLGISVFNKYKFVSKKSISDKSKTKPKCIN